LEGERRKRNAHLFYNIKKIKGEKNCKNELITLMMNAPPWMDGASR
jgi:hypothetical protein